MAKYVRKSRDVVRTASMEAVKGHGPDGDEYTVEYSKRTKRYTLRRAGELVISASSLVATTHRAAEHQVEWETEPTVVWS